MISVVIPAYNDGKYIGRVLSSIKNQKINNLEIIVVDGGSTDNTVRIAKKYAPIIKQKKRGVSNARNIGANIARGEILYFVDGDTVVKKGTLDELERIFKDASISMASGPIEPLERVNISIKLVFWLSSLSSRISVLIKVPLFIGSNIAVRKSVFSRINGFNESLITSEDLDFSRRAGKFGRTVFSKRLRVMPSARRVIEWGVLRFFLFSVYNLLRFFILGRPVRNYPHISG